MKRYQRIPSSLGASWCDPASTGPIWYLIVWIRTNVEFPGPQPHHYILKDSIKHFRESGYGL